MINPELMLRIVRESPLIAYDTETSGLSVRDFICGYVVTSAEHSLYTPVRHQAGGNIPDVDDFERALNLAFAERGRLGYRTVGHHLGFDLRSSLRHGITLLSPLEDTMINEGLIDDTTIGYGLDDCSRRHGVTVKLGAELYQVLANRFGGMPDRSSMQHFWKIEGDHPVAVDYACGDGISTLELWQSQQGMLDAENLRRVWKLECDLLPYLARIHNRGIKVDHEYGEMIGPKLKERLDEAKRSFPPGFNARSPKEVEALYRNEGYTDGQFARTAGTPKNPNGQVSFTEKWLETNGIGERLLGIRRLEKAQGSFIDPLLVTHNVNGRVHPILNQSKSDEYGVAGARLSCSDPNLQAYPKRNKDVGKTVRPLIIPDTGMVIEEADAKQQEPRLFAHYSGEPALVNGYVTGTMDIHDLSDSYFHLGRDGAKRLGMGMLTGMQPKALAGHMRWPLDRAEEAHRLFLTDAFPLIGKFQADAKAVFLARKVVRSILGRKARLTESKWAYRAVSRIIQNSGGDHMKTCILRACQWEDAYPNDLQVLLSIHDSLMWQRDVGHDRTELIRVLENVVHEPDFGMTVPIPFDVGTGSNWAEASYGK